MGDPDTIEMQSLQDILKGQASFVDKKYPGVTNIEGLSEANQEAYRNMVNVDSEGIQAGEYGQVWRNIFVRANRDMLVDEFEMPEVASHLMKSVDADIIPGAVQRQVIQDFAEAVLSTRPWRKSWRTTSSESWTTPCCRPPSS